MSRRAAYSLSAAGPPYAARPPANGSAGAAILVALYTIGHTLALAAQLVSTRGGATPLTVASLHS